MVNFFCVTSGEVSFPVLFSDILYFEADKTSGSVIVFALTGKYVSNKSLEEIEQMLPGLEFCRVHPSYIIALCKMKQFNQRHAIIDGRKIPIAKKFMLALRSRIIVFGDGETPEGFAKLSQFDTKNLISQIRSN